MSSELQSYMYEKTGISFEKLPSLSDAEFGNLYEKAMELEEIAAVDSSRNGDIATVELTLATQFVDFLYAY